MGEVGVEGGKERGGEGREIERGEVRMKERWRKGRRGGGVGKRKELALEE